MSSHRIDYVRYDKHTGNPAKPPANGTGLGHILGLVDGGDVGEETGLEQRRFIGGAARMVGKMPSFDPSLDFVPVFVGADEDSIWEPWAELALRDLSGENTAYPWMPLTEFTLGVGIDGKEHRYKYCKVNELTVEGSEEEPLKVSLGIMSRDKLEQSPPAMSPITPGDHFEWWTGAVKLVQGGTTLDALLVKSFSIKLNNNLEKETDLDAQPATAGLPLLRAPRRLVEGDEAVSVELTCREAVSAAFFQSYGNTIGTSVQFVAEFGIAPGVILAMTVNDLALSSRSTSVVTGADRLEHSFSLEAALNSRALSFEVTGGEG